MNESDAYKKDCLDVDNWLNFFKNLYNNSFVFSYRNQIIESSSSLFSTSYYRDVNITNYTDKPNYEYISCLKDNRPFSTIANWKKAAHKIDDSEVVDEICSSDTFRKQKQLYFDSLSDYDEDVKRITSFNNRTTKRKRILSELDPYVNNRMFLVWLPIVQCCIGVFFLVYAFYFKTTDNFWVSVGNFFLSLLIALAGCAGVIFVILLLSRGIIPFSADRSTKLLYWYKRPNYSFSDTDYARTTNYYKKQMEHREKEFEKSLEVADKEYDSIRSKLREEYKRITEKTSIPLAYRNYYFVWMIKCLLYNKKCNSIAQCFAYIDTGVSYLQKTGFKYKLNIPKDDNMIVLSSSDKTSQQEAASTSSDYAVSWDDFVLNYKFSKNDNK